MATKLKTVRYTGNLTSIEELKALMIRLNPMLGRNGMAGVMRQHLTMECLCLAAKLFISRPKETKDVKEFRAVYSYLDQVGVWPWA